jgi:lipoate-protein ligase A
VLLADREFIGKEWFAWLQRREIPFVIRVRNNTLVNGKKVSTLFAKVPNKGFLHLKKVCNVWY